MDFDYDYIIIGSGFGGSVSALRLAEKGYSVCVLEKGKRFEDKDFPKTNWDLRRYLWLPLFRCFGIQNLTLFRNILILSGTGVGGGSLVYANTLLQPGDEFFESPAWKDLADWKAELSPHYATAKKMLGVVPNPKLTFVDEFLRDCAKDLAREDTFKPSNVAIFFGEPGKTVPDPYFEGKGPARSGCIFCGGCMVGCRHNAKNTLTKNYLYFAEKLGVRILPERAVFDVKPIKSQGGSSEGYAVLSSSSTNWIRKESRTLTARNVIFSGGVLGTLSLLFRCKFVTKSLPRISDFLGHHVRTNSEALVGAVEPHHSKERDYSTGIAIGSIFHPDPYTHIEPVRYPKGSNFMRLLAAPMIDGEGKMPRALKLFFTLIMHPWRTLQFFRMKDWASSGVILLVMQTLDNKMRFHLGRNLYTLFRKRLTTSPEVGKLAVPSYIPIANKVARSLAKKINGVPQSAINEVLLNIPTTAHILGGCSIGASKENGVIDLRHQIFDYPGLFICDGSVIPANLGVNPSLTITAMTERAISLIPPKTSPSI